MKALRVELGCKLLPLNRSEVFNLTTGRRSALLCETLRERDRKYHWILGHRPGLSNLNL
ncbi:MAG: hypothetical protein V7K55_17425 [Nostoc sp.]|uniref:hypothetical protein n=1 Tax=Nostoc sp. TaxID=1180 RepID=UPI002FF7A01A